MKKAPKKDTRATVKAMPADHLYLKVEAAKRPGVSMTDLLGEIIAAYKKQQGA
jgi:hypothetical protein